MTPERLRELIQRGESLNVEFKGEPRGPLSDEDIVKAVVCMANRPSSESGWILIGLRTMGA